MDPDPTFEEQCYINEFDIPIDRVIYADGLRGNGLKEVMRERDAWVAYGAAPCVARGHTLRLRSGHCLPCRPAGLTYLKKHDLAGYVYLARAGESSIYKIGVASDVPQRMAGLNKKAYGGYSNWRLVCSHHYYSSAGFFEYIARISVRGRSVPGEYFTNDGGWVKSREMFVASGDEIDEIMREIFKYAR